MRRRAAALALVPVLGLLAACGGGEDADDPTIAVPTPTTSAVSSVVPTGSAEPDYTAGDNAPDPCSLLTAAEVSAAVGATVSAGVTSEDGPPLGGETCLWSTSTAPARTFSIDLKDGGDIAVPDLTPEKLVDQSITTLVGLTPVSGVGEKAAFGDATGVVYAKGLYVLTSVGLGSSGTAGAALRSLTEKAVAAL